MFFRNVKCFVSILTVVWLSSQATFASVGGRGGGGDIKKDFQGKALLAINYLRSLKQNRIDVNELSYVYEHATIEATPVLLDSSGQPLPNQTYPYPQYLYAWSIPGAQPKIQLRMRSNEETKNPANDYSWQGKFDAKTVGLDDVVHELLQASTKYSGQDDGYQISRGAFALNTVLETDLMAPAKDETARKKLNDLLPVEVNGVKFLIDPTDGVAVNQCTNHLEDEKTFDFEVLLPLKRKNMDSLFMKILRPFASAFTLPLAPLMAATGSDDLSGNWSDVANPNIIGPTSHNFSWNDQLDKIGKGNMKTNKEVDVLSALPDFNKQVKTNLSQLFYPILLGFDMSDSGVATASKDYEIDPTSPEHDSDDFDTLKRYHKYSLKMHYALVNLECSQFLGVVRDTLNKRFLEGRAANYIALGANAQSTVIPTNDPTILMNTVNAQTEQVLKQAVLATMSRSNVAH
jgi:hypothetical protein